MSNVSNLWMTFLLIILAIDLLSQLAFFFLKYVTVARTFGEIFNRLGFEITRGMIERSVLTLGMISGFPQVLIPFGVLKLQNRIGMERDSGDDDQKENARAYFLIGNLLTILLSLTYVLIARHCFELSL